MACPSSLGSRAAARWLCRGSAASASAHRVCQTPVSRSHHKTPNVNVGGVVRSRRGVRVGCLATREEIDTESLIASYLDEQQLKQVKLFALALLEKNKHMNLTGASTVEEVLTRHVADSLALIPAIEAALGVVVTKKNTGVSQSKHTTESDSQDKDTKHNNSDKQDKDIDNNNRDKQDDDTEHTENNPGHKTKLDPETEKVITVLDVGSGAGFPGIALAIARPFWRVTLLDSLQKRVDFLSQASALCGASNIDTLWSRAEDAGKVGSAHREQYDVVMARAVAELRTLSELCVPLVKVGGVFCAAKNSRGSIALEVEAASSAIEVLGGAPFQIVEVQSTGPDGEKRTAVVSRKVGNTPVKYPRRAGTPNKKPL